MATGPFVKRTPPRLHGTRIVESWPQCRDCRLFWECLTSLGVVPDEQACADFASSDQEEGPQVDLGRWFQ